MFDKYMIGENSLKNVTASNEITGFQFTVRITYYRSLGLSMVEGFDVTVDGTTFPREVVLFTVGGKTYRLDEMEREGDNRWEFGEEATLTIPKPGGLAPGEHTVDVAQHLRISYLPFPGGGHDAKTLTLAA